LLCLYFVWHFPSRGRSRGRASPRSHGKPEGVRVWFLPQDYCYSKKVRASGALVWGAYANSRPELGINANFHEFSSRTRLACPPSGSGTLSSS
jgi:hypothetical protein